MIMRRLLGTVLPAALLVTALAACGDETASDSPGADPSVTVSSPGGTGGLDTPDTPGPDDEGSVAFDLVDTITVTAAGGALSEVAVPFTDDAAFRDFLGQFQISDMTDQIQNAVAGADIAQGQELYAAVVAIGCDSPSEVTVTDSGAGLVVTALKVLSPVPECFAAMTTVALVVAEAGHPAGTTGS